MRSNVSPTHIFGDFETLSEALDYAARGETGFNFYSARGELEATITYRGLRALARDTAFRLLGLGLRRGDRVGIVAETGVDFMAAFFGCQYAGLLPCPLPYSMYLGGKDAYIERIAGMLSSAGAAAVVGPDDLSEHVSAAAAAAGVSVVRTFAELSRAPAARCDLVPSGRDEAAYIQYSSGSTSEPKGVLVTQRAITANAAGILTFGLHVRPGDRAFSWLPLYHDMGLVGFCIAPMMGQVSVDYLATTAFARRPALWLRLMSDNRTTVTYSPTFGYDLAGRRINGDARKLDLSNLRVAGIGGDMVRPDVLAAFAERLAVAGFRASAFLPSYGMAESTLAVSFAELDAPLKVDTVDQAHLKLSRRAVPAKPGNGAQHRARTFVVCGRPLPGHEIVVVDDEGSRLEERQVGRVLVRGPSVMAGYFDNDEATRAVMHADGFMDTGDMGYMLGGEIVITGRVKDLILHNGRNIWPQDIEWTAERIEPLRSGDVAAFAVEDTDGTDRVVVLVQCRLTEPDAIEELRRAVHAAVHRSAGVECEVVLVGPRSLPFTSSGKLSRAGAKARYLSGEIREIASIGLPPEDVVLRVAAR
ncbi:MAG TPA: fatty acyl-AMP ligase [Aestuariivirgaceae bacterium]|nr:fatty acyl-AMP ligase [Aestuariivirgaceae bacterium]